MTRSAALVAVVVLLLAGCSDDGDDGRSGGSGSSSTTTEAPVAASDGSVVGTWTADAGDELDQRLADQGLEEAPACTGAITLELAADGTFTRTVTGTCDFGDDDGEVELVASGRYATEDGMLALTDVTGSGAITGADGEELPIADADVAEDGSVAYEVTADELTLSVPDSETPPQTLTRT